MKKQFLNHNYENDAKRVFKCLQKGGVAIVYMDVAYAIVSGTDDALSRVYKAKKRNLRKKSGIVANLQTHEKIQVLSEDSRSIIKSIVEKHNLPISVIAKYKKNYPPMKGLTAFMSKMATKNGTVNFLLNSGPLRDQIAYLSIKNNFPLVASSANISKKGTKYRVQDIEPEICDIADIIVDYGPSKYMQDGQSEQYPLSSTQIDFRSLKLVRKGICFKKIQSIMKNEFRIKI